MTSRHIRLVAASLLWIAPLESRAAMMEHYDLSSLVLMSKHVVLAEWGEKRAVKRPFDATSFKVLKVYKGSFIPGQTIEILEPGAYDLEGQIFSLSLLKTRIRDSSSIPGRSSSSRSGTRIGQEW